MKTFYWSKAPSGDLWLFDKPALTPRSPIGSIYPRRRQQPARASLYGSKPFWFEAHNAGVARRQFERLLDIRSLGLFGDDDIQFIMED